MRPVPTDANLPPVSSLPLLCTTRSDFGHHWLVRAERHTLLQQLRGGSLDFWPQPLCHDQEIDFCGPAWWCHASDRRWNLPGCQLGCLVSTSNVHQLLAVGAEGRQIGVVPLHRPDLLRREGGGQRGGLGLPHEARPGWQRPLNHATSDRATHVDARCVSLHIATERAPVGPQRRQVLLHLNAEQGADAGTLPFANPALLEHQPADGKAGGEYGAHGGANDRPGTLPQATPTRACLQSGRLGGCESAN